MSTNDSDLVPVGYFVLDAEGRVLDCNTLGAETAGTTAAEIKGRPFTNLVSATDTWRFQKHLRMASRSGDRESCRVELEVDDHGRRLTHLFTRAEFDEQGVVRAYHTAVLTVAAELIRAKEEAEQMSRLKTAFLANMSHEIRTPLTGIIGFASILSKELPDEHREFADLISGSGRRLLQMLNSVLDLAKLESNQMELEADRVDLASEVNLVAEMLKPLADDKGLSMDVVVRGDRPPVARADRAALNRILHNLIGNALKFTNAGHVRVEVWATGDHVGFEVSDTGIGIDAAFIPNLFNDFSQESVGINRSHHGAGIGLTIVKRLVDLMDGEIEVESEKRRGSRFVVRLPYADVATAPAGEPMDDFTPLAEDADGPTIRILLVEDHHDTQHLLKEVLEEKYGVSVVGGASEAFELAKRQVFDMVLMDIDLGDGPDGVYLLKKLRALPAYQTTPIVALTAHALPGDESRFLDIGFTEYVSKPFDVDRLIQLPLELT